MYNTKFVIDDRLIGDNVSETDDFGRGVCMVNNNVLVGAPKDDGNTLTDGSSKLSNDGTVISFDLIKDDTYAWKNITTEDPLIDIKKLEKFLNSTRLANNLEITTSCMIQ